MAAIYVKQNKIIGLDHNKIRTHPIQKHWAQKQGKPYAFLHAEIAAAVGCNREYLKDSTVYVVRVNKHNELRCSYPCVVCYPFLQSVGVKRIVCCSADRSMVEIEI